MMGQFGPISHITPKLTSVEDYGPHWSLIIDEGADLYAYIEPNTPNKYTTVLKRKVLASNSFVDAYKYDRFWDQASFTATAAKPGYPARNPATSKTTYYDIGDKSRQVLANVLIAVQ